MRDDSTVPGTRLGASQTEEASQDRNTHHASPAHYGPLLLLIGALIALAAGFTASGSGVFLLVVSIVLSVAALGWRSLANRNRSARRPHRPEVGHGDKATPVRSSTAEERPGSGNADLTGNSTWDWLNALPPIYFADQGVGSDSPSSQPTTGAGGMEEATCSVIESCVRPELSQLRAEFRESQQLLVSTLLQRIEDVATAERQLREQLGSAMERAQSWMAQSRDDTDQKLNRLMEASGRLRSDASDATNEATEWRTALFQAVGRLAGEVESSRAQAIAKTDLAAVASLLDAKLARQLSGLRSEVEASSSALEKSVTDAEARLEERLETMARPTTEPAAVATQGAATNSALSPIRTDIRILRNEVAAVERAVAELTASVERSSAKPMAAGGATLATLRPPAKAAAPAAKRSTKASPVPGVAPAAAVKKAKPRRPPR